MKTVRTSDLLYVFLAVSGLALGCGDDTSTLDESGDPSQVGDGDGDSSHGDDEGDGDSSNGDGDNGGDGDAEGDGDDANQGDGDALGDGDGDTQGDGDTGDGDAQGDGDTGDGDAQGDGDTGDGDAQGDGDTGDGDNPDFDADAAKAVLLRSCATCHKYGHPKFSIVGAGNMLDMSAVQQRAESMADALYDAKEPMPPYAAQGQLTITSDERENLHAYLLSLRE
jgi:mono/diheme cytochrome c family protein